MKLERIFGKLTLFEWCLWLCSLITVILCSILAKSDWMNISASAIGVTALIFVAKGLPIGQLLTVIFSFAYALVSFQYHYWGEMITYLGMSMPIALFSFLSWLRHPFKEDSSEVKIEKISKMKFFFLCVVTLAVTVAFFFILKGFSTPNLLISTLSVTTSFFAASLLFFRSPYYAIAYASNDLVLIWLWVLASISNPTFVPMIACFFAFFFNDIYGFISWKRRQKRQAT